MISIFNQTMIHTSLHKRQQKSLLLAREQKDAHMLCYTPKNQDYEKKNIIFVMFPWHVILVVYVNVMYNFVGFSLFNNIIFFFVFSSNCSWKKRHCLLLIQKHVCYTATVLVENRSLFKSYRIQKTSELLSHN